MNNNNTCTFIIALSYSHSNEEISNSCTFMLTSKFLGSCIEF